MYSVLGGIVALLLSIWGFYKWWFIFADIFKGLIPLILLIFGIIAVVNGAKKMREEADVESKPGPKDRKTAVEDDE